jgi:O-antigen/teichoic acid export membrane protein
MATRVTDLLQRLWSPALLAYGVTGAVAVASFASTLLLARIAGPVVIGQYALAVTTANLLVIFALQGLDRILIREVAGDLRTGDTGRARGVLRLTARRVLLVSATAALVWLLLILTTPLNGWLGGHPDAMRLVALFVAVTTIYRLAIAAVRAVGAPLAGQWVEAAPTLLLPLAFLAWRTTALPLTAAEATALVIAFNALALAAALLFLRPKVRGWAPAVLPGPALLLAGLPLMANMFLQLFSDWFILAQLSSSASPADAGAYRVTQQIITIFLTIMTTSEAYVGARIAGDFRIGRPDLAWGRHRRATFLMLALALPVLLVCLLAPAWLLATAFGPAFVPAATALAIMAAAQIVNIGRGPMGAMLTMAGHNRLQLNMTVAGLALGVTASFLLIPRFGLTGAAIAQVLPILTRSILGYAAGRRLIPRVPAAMPEAAVATKATGGAAGK